MTRVTDASAALVLVPPSIYQHAHHHLGGPVDGGIAVASPQSIDVCAAFVASPFTNAGTGSMRVFQLHHPRSAYAHRRVCCSHCVAVTNTMQYHRNYLALVLPSSADTGPIVLSVSFTDRGITISSPLCRPRCAAVHQRR